MENPKIIISLKPMNSMGFIVENGVRYFYNKVLKMYMRQDVVKQYRKLRKKYPPTSCLVKSVILS